jgi:phosphatidylinositol-bisphosphatase
VFSLLNDPAPWNTNGKSPPPRLDISQWLDAAAERPDIVVVGFQEIVPLTPGKVLAVEDSAATAEWETIIAQALNGAHGAAPGAAAEAAAAVAATAAGADPFTVVNEWGGKPVPPETEAARRVSGTDGWTSFDDTPVAAAAAAASEPELGRDWMSFDTPAAAPASAPAAAATSAGNGSRPTYVRLACKQLVGRCRLNRSNVC